jgi:hypothetical protein
LKLEGTDPVEDELLGVEQLESATVANIDKLNSATNLTGLTPSNPNTTHA